MSESNAFLREKPGMRREIVVMRSLRKEGVKLVLVMKPKVRFVLKKPSWMRLLRRVWRESKSPALAASAARLS